MRIGYLANQTVRCWGLSVSEIAETMTLYPYYAAFCNANQRRVMDKYVFADSGKGLIHSIRLPCRSGMGSSVRYCKSCFSEDIEKGLRRYWRRAHQLPGVYLCHIHACNLYEVRFDPLCRGMKFPHPDDFDVMGGREIELNSSNSQRSLHLYVAILSNWLLNNKVAIEVDDLERRLNLCLRQAGYGMWKRNVWRAEFHQDVFAAFGSEYLTWAGVPGWPGNQGSVMQRYKNGLIGRSPLKEILFVAFFAAAAHRSPRNWPICINPFASHGPNHPVRERLLRPRTSRYTAFCDCGMSFTYDCAPEGQPQNSKIFLYGREFAMHLRSLRAQRVSCSEISRRLSIARRTVRLLIKGLDAKTSPRPGSGRRQQRVDADPELKRV